MPTPGSRLDDCIAYHGLFAPTKSDVDIRVAALGHRIDPDELLARVAQLRAASHRLVQARIDYVERTRGDFALLKSVADADAAYADRRMGTTEMDLLLLANRVAGN